MSESEQAKSSQKDGFPRELLTQPSTAKLAYFENKVIAHPLLKSAFETLLHTIYQPAGASIIWVYGPTGAGKTTLLKRIVRQLIEEEMENMKKNPGYIPVVSVGLQDVSTETSGFDWKDFFKCIMRAQNEPLLDEKIGYDTPSSLSRSAKQAKSTADYRSAARECLRFRQSKAIIIDEAQHFKKVVSGRRLQDQMDNIKALAETTDIVHVLVGTYELLDLTNLSGQLSRRSVEIHFPRYRCENNREMEIFKNILMNFEAHVPVPKKPKLVERSEYFYEGCAGCIGILKGWLWQALAEAIENDATTLTLQCLQRHAKPTRELMRIVQEISEGEKSLKEGKSDRAEIRKLLGLKLEKGEKEEVQGEAQAQKEGQTGHSAADEQVATTARPKKRDVGRRNPKRDPVGIVREEGK